MKYKKQTWCALSKADVISIWSTSKIESCNAGGKHIRGNQGNTGCLSPMLYSKEMYFVHTEHFPTTAGFLQSNLNRHKPEVGRAGCFGAVFQWCHLS